MGTTLESIKDLNRQSAVLDAENLFRLNAAPVRSTPGTTHDVPEIVVVRVPVVNLAEQEMVRSETLVDPSINVRIASRVRRTSPDNLQQPVEVEQPARVEQRAEVEPIESTEPLEAIESSSCEFESDDSQSIGLDDARVVTTEHATDNDNVESAPEWKSIEFSQADVDTTQTVTSLWESAYEEASVDDIDSENSDESTESFGDVSEENSRVDSDISESEEATPIEPRTLEVMTDVQNDSEARVTVRPAHWYEMERAREREAAVGTSPERDRCTDQMVDRILQVCPSVSPWCIMITGVDSAEDAIATGELVSRAFAKRDLGQVLLIDADSGSKELTTRFQHRDAEGLVDLINDDADSRSLIKPTESGQLDFLPCGLGRPWRQKSGASRLAKIISQLKRDYAYIFVSGESSQDWFCQSLASQCDATFMVISLAETDSTVAKTAVDELRLYGARLLGCIVAE